jgi:hypothetical protein
VQIRLSAAIDPSFLFSAVVIARNERDQARTLRHLPKDILQEVDRATKDIRNNGARLTTAALVLTADQLSSPLAYAYVSEYGTATDATVAELSGVCVDPGAKGHGLSALAVQEALSGFDSSTRLRDSLGAAAILLQRGYEETTPEYGVIMPNSPYSMWRDTLIPAPDGQVTTLPSEPTVGDLRQAIEQIFPNLPVLAQ